VLRLLVVTAQLDEESEHNPTRVRQFFQSHVENLNNSEFQYPTELAETRDRALLGKLSKRSDQPQNWRDCLGNKKAHQGGRGAAHER
jgi:hypothetical protein